jgi:hypothetical protein
MAEEDYPFDEVHSFNQYRITLKKRYKIRKKKNRDIINVEVQSNIIL